MLVISTPRGYDCHLNITRWSEGTVSISLLISLKLNPADLYKAASRVNSSCMDRWQMKKISTVCLDHQIIPTLLIMFSVCVRCGDWQEICKTGSKGNASTFPPEADANNYILRVFMCLCAYIDIIYAIKKAFKKCFFSFLSICH